MTYTMDTYFIFLMKFVILYILTGRTVTAMRVVNPNFKEVATSANYNVGETAILFCSVKNLGKRTVSWRKLPNPNPLTVGLSTWVKDSRIHVEHVPNSQQWNLIIENTDLDDEGTYECQVNIKGRKKLKHQVELKLKDITAKRHARIQIVGANDIKKGGAIYIVCNVTVIEDETETVYWLKDNVRLDNIGSNRVTIKNSVTYNSKTNDIITSRLSIKNSDMDDAGNYMCQSSDGSQMAGIKIDIVSASSNTKRAGKMQEMKYVDGSTNSGQRQTFPGLILLTVFIIHIVS